MVADAPANVRSVLFVPAHRERGSLRLRPDYGLRLYSRKILIQEHNKELLPEYLRFVEGVVDSEDLPLNVARETIQSNPVLRQLKKALTNRVHKELKALAEQEDETKYTSFWTEFGVFIKEGVATDYTSQETLVELLRFRSSKTGEEGWTTLKAYTERMGADQKVIYYVLGESLKTVARSPHLDYFRQHDLEVLYLVDPVDGWMVSSLRAYNEKPLQTVDDANLDLPTAAETEAAEPTVGQEAFDQLAARVRLVLGERVRDVRESKTLVDHPARLVSADDTPERDLQILRRMMEEQYTAPTKLLELNRSHPFIADLARLVTAQPGDERIDPAIQQLLDNLLLMDGAFQGSIADMVERVQKLMAAALAG